MKCLLSRDALKIEVSPIERVSSLIKDENTINLAGGSPDPSFIPVNEIREAFNEIIEEYGAKAFFYPGAGGLEELKKELSKWCDDLSVGVGPSELVVTSGAQHAMTLLSQALLSKEEFAHENPTFVETMNPLKFYGGSNLLVSVDSDGMRTVELEEKIRGGHSPKVVYTVPTCHNPSGVTMTHERRKHLVELAEKHNFLIIEDDPYRPIAQEQPQTLYSMTKSENVVYVGSMSKAVAPGLRIGFVVTRNDELAEKLRELQQMDFSTSTSNQLTMARLLKKKIVQSRLGQLRRHYREKLGILLQSLTENRMDTVFQPRDGFFTLVDVKTDVEKLLTVSLLMGVAFVPGRNFYFNEAGSTYIRLSVGPVDKSKIIEGVNRLRRALGEIE